MGRFWALGTRTASSTSQRRFLETFTEYANSVVQQAEYRNIQRIPTVEEYLEIRRQTIGVYPSFCMIELPYDLPDHVFDHPVVKDLARFSRDLIILDNVSLSRRYFFPISKLHLALIPGYPILQQGTSVRKDTS